MMMEPSRDAFNSILKLDLPSNRPFNLMINAGATEVVSLLAPRFTFNEMLEYTRRLCLDNSISLTQKPTVLRHVQEIAIVPSVTYWQAKICCMVMCSPV